MPERAPELRRDGHYFAEIVLVDLPYDGILDGFGARNGRQAGHQGQLAERLARAHERGLGALPVIVRQYPHPARFDEEQGIAGIFLMADDFARLEHALLDIADDPANVLGREIDHQVQY